ncbi:hypothetical protein A2U01_0085461, partial [Trifolium medium]|nr:hypothetical protein [Trifolium medium]
KPLRADKFKELRNMLDDRTRSCKLLALPEAVPEVVTSGSTR